MIHFKSAFALLALLFITFAAAGAEPHLRLCIFGDIQPQPHMMKNPMQKGSPYWYTQQLYSMANKMGVDAYLITGDIANHCDPAAYDLFRKIFDDSVAGMKNQPQWLPVMGNHDFWGTFWDKNTPDGYGKKAETRAERKEIFRKHLKLDSIHHHKVINGYDVIGYSIEGGMFLQPDAVREIEGMIKKAIARDAEKPIFIFAHNHTGHTVRGSFTNHYFYKMLAKYPQVIYFSGHTHIPLEDERTIHQQDFTSVGTAALLNVSLVGNILQYNERNLGKTMLYVTVDDKAVVLRRFQLRDGSEILDNGKPWTLPLPLKKENFTYTAAKRQKIAPEFPENAELKAGLIFDKAKKFSGVALTGTAATHPNCVYSYRISIFEKDGDKWVAKQGMFQGKPREFLELPGDYYKGRNYQKPTFSGRILIQKSNYAYFIFEPGKTYRIDLKAQDSLGAVSARTLSAEIAIPR